MPNRLFNYVYENKYIHIQQNRAMQIQYLYIHNVFLYL